MHGSSLRPASDSLPDGRECHHRRLKDLSVREFVFSPAVNGRRNAWRVSDFRQAVAALLPWPAIRH